MPQSLSKTLVEPNPKRPKRNPKSLNKVALVGTLVSAAALAGNLSSDEERTETKDAAAAAWGVATFVGIVALTL